MRTLLILRHAKSDWSSSVDDHERPLAKRGRNAAQTIGRFLTRAGQAPDAVVVSPARRAAETAALAVAAGGWHCTVRTNNLLYGANAYATLDAIRAESDDVKRLMVVGHEPTSSETVTLLVGGGRHRLPTAAVAGIDVDVSRWTDVEPACGHLSYLIPPRLLAPSGRGGS